MVNKGTIKMTDLVFNGNARNDLLKGVDKLARAVASTMGPHGNTVAIYKNKMVHPTKDGVTVAKSIVLSNPNENIGAMMVKEASARSAALAGDGTTTSTVLAADIISNGMRLIEAGYTANDIKRGIELASKKVLDGIDKLSIKIKDSDTIRQIANISSNSDESITQYVTEAVQAVGSTGVIMVDNGSTSNDSIIVTKGINFNTGIISHYSVTDRATNSCIYRDINIIFIDDTVTDISAIAHIARSGPCVVIANSYDDQVLHHYARIASGVQLALVKAPNYGQARTESLEDMATACGGKVIRSMDLILNADTDSNSHKLDAGNRLTDLFREHCGSAASFKSTRTETTITKPGGNKIAIDSLVDDLKTRLSNSSDKFETGTLQERISRLTTGVAKIYVGATTESAVKERKDRYDDAVAACKAALKDGIVPGGGVALMRASGELDTLEANNESIKAGIRIVKEACVAPLRQIVANADGKVDLVINKLQHGNETFGYDASTEDYGDMIELGIVDPALVTKTALESAVSVAGVVLTTNCLVVDEQYASKGVAIV